MVEKACSVAGSVGIGADDVNSRGLSGEPSVETKPNSDEGPVQFSTDQDAGPRSKPHLDEEGADDPRRHEEADAVDVFDATLADEEEAGDADDAA